MKKEKTTRRTFLNRLWLGLGAIATAEVIALTVAYFKPRPRSQGAGDEQTVFDVGPVEQFEPGSVTAFMKGRFYLARLPDGGFLALSRTCTHLSCSVPWVAEENRFVCPCHASAFDIRGDVIDPPAPRALDLFVVKIENGMVSVDTAKRTRRTAFAPGQAAYPVQA